MSVCRQCQTFFLSIGLLTLAAEMLLSCAFLPLCLSGAEFMTKTGCCPAMLCEASSGRFHAVSKVFFVAREGEEEVTVKGGDEADGGATRKENHVT